MSLDYQAPGTGKESRAWSVDRRVTIGVILFVVGVMVNGAWGLSSLERRVDENSVAIANHLNDDKGRFPLFINSVDRLARVETKIDLVQKQLDEIRGIMLKKDGETLPPKR